MENKEMNRNAPVELDEETLNVVSGGVEPPVLDGEETMIIIPSNQITEEAEKRYNKEPY